MNLAPAVAMNLDAEYGRIKIYTDAKEITKVNVVEIFNSAYMIHQHNAIKEDEQRFVPLFVSQWYSVWLCILTKQR
jgi:hypothetical protein